jgi:SHS2 domain-containing protein
MEKKYKNLDHTGDLKIEVFGHSLQELMENASMALTDTMVELQNILPKLEVEWNISGESTEELLVGQLQEILYRFDSEGMVFAKFQISLLGPNWCRCLAYGEPLDREKHGFKTEIKAVTYHQLFVGEENNQWVARIILDV